MYVIRDKKSKELLHLEHSLPGDERSPEEIYPDFDSRTMEFGVSDEASVPAWFTIEEGVVKPTDPPPRERPRHPPVEAPDLSLEELKTAALEHYSQMSLRRREQLIPEHQLQNAALGLYDEERTEAIRDTVAAFRNEYHRLEAAIERAESAEDLEGLRSRFPRRVAPRRRRTTPQEEA